MPLASKIQSNRAEIIIGFVIAALLALIVVGWFWG